MKKIQTETEQQQKLLLNEQEKAKISLEQEKKFFIENIKKMKKEDLVPKQEKISIWQRIKKTLVG
jgi:hypothetical protein